MSQTEAARYVMGHDDRERRRLALQASILKPFTESLLKRAGIVPGMHVLDIGCGVGDVTLIAAELVGRHGSVTSLDLDGPSLETVGRRAAESGFDHVTTVQSSIQEFQPERTFDAVMGRHILVHLPEPLVLMKKALEWLHQGGAAVFHEYDFNVLMGKYPQCPMTDRVYRAFRDLFCRDGLPGTGTRLFHWFWEAGFPPPECRAEYPFDGGPDSLFYEWIAESFRSVYPRLQAMGLVADFDVNLETLERDMREEVVRRRAGVFCPPLVGAFARKP